MWLREDITSYWIQGLAWQIDPLVARSGDSGMTVWMIGGVVGVVVLSCAGYLIFQALEQRKRNSHPVLFNGLCRVHEFDRSKKKLLKRVVRFNRLAKPALLFVDPRWLQAAIRNPSFSRDREMLQGIQVHLFGNLVAGEGNKAKDAKKSRSGNDAAGKAAGKKPVKKRVRQAPAGQAPAGQVDGAKPVARKAPSKSKAGPATRPQAESGGKPKKRVAKKPGSAPRRPPAS